MSKLMTEDSAYNSSENIAEKTLAMMRVKLGKSSIASHYDRLCKAHKQLLLHHAGINADLHWDNGFEHFDRRQRNDIRHAIIELINLAHFFNKVNLCKDQCHLHLNSIKSHNFNTSSG
ncbi:hypothetical protein JQC92_18580 [Shewanella sp. 202IG2-18]|uniref:hypothetical protein n=1 Tax=Parashewanella hymeniacidonis TaxID=2807618 RepID=UPI001961FB9F|nr:hypothetical protein [Parashewanella hymeniacidonis]MBM7074015.1 hypothetical protein [Parashewanella hymeniacidonis]